jgi:hypothetical protein
LHLTNAVFTAPVIKQFVRKNLSRQDARSVKKRFSTVNNNASFSSATKFFDQRMEIIMFQKQDIIINRPDTEGERR